ncbi:PocR ligand-binding domain-containing protein [Alishewanella sp. d11]|uniref:PocR ligand-binding domain-containing protein n=1 Tax=Alishewanella sp. d11 TaxID=3414030 RepID=UPI003BF79FDC
MSEKPSPLDTGSHIIQMFDPLQADWNQRPADRAAFSAETAFFQADDLQSLNAIFDSFCKVVGVTIALIDLNGKVLASSRWQRACMHFHRVAPDTQQRCYESDLDLSQQMLAGKDYALYRCKNGLTDCVAPLVVDHEHIANLFIGQFLLSAPDNAFFAAQAQQSGFDTTDYMQAIAEIPIIQESSLPALLELVSALANHIARLCKANHKNQQFIDSIAQQINERTQELQMQNAILSMISQDEPLSRILHALVQLLEAEHAEVLCSILLLNAETKTLHLGAAPSLPKAYNDALEGVAIGPAVGSCGVAAYTGKISYAEDILTHPNWQPFLELAKLAGVRACWSKPIINSHGEVLGTFALYHREPKIPAESVLEKVEVYSHLAEVAISRHQANQKIRHLALFDGLTHLPNRTYLYERLEQAMAYSQRNKQYCALLFIDLNNFKPINDHYGHSVGDAVLVETATRLLTQVRQTDTVARFGGDEFIVLLTNLDEAPELAAQQAQLLKAKLKHILQQPYQLPSTTTVHQSSASIGLVTFQGQQLSIDALLQAADTAMYQEKNAR